MIRVSLRSVGRLDAGLTRSFGRSASITVFTPTSKRTPVNTPYQPPPYDFDAFTMYKQIAERRAFRGLIIDIRWMWRFNFAFGSFLQHRVWHSAEIIDFIDVVPQPWRCLGIVSPHKTIHWVSSKMHRIRELSSRSDVQLDHTEYFPPISVQHLRFSRGE